MQVAGLATDQDRAAVGPGGPGQDLDEGALAGTVGAHQGVDLARAHRQGGVAQRRDGAIALGDPGDLEEQVSHVFLSVRGMPASRHPPVDRRSA